MHLYLQTTHDQYRSVYPTISDPSKGPSLVFFFSGTRKRTAHQYIKKKEGNRSPKCYRYEGSATHPKDKLRGSYKKDIHDHKRLDQNSLVAGAASAWARRWETPRAPAIDHCLVF
jgi:hypothetical protein